LSDDAISSRLLEIATAARDVSAAPAAGVKNGLRGLCTSVAMNASASSSRIGPSGPAGAASGAWRAIQ
jgi:hypothetical protein